MKKPDDLADLLENLKEAGHTPKNVELGAEPRAVVYIGDKSLTLGGKDCAHLFDTPATARQFADAMGNTRNMSLELQDLIIGDDVISVLEEAFSTVDEL